MSREYLVTENLPGRGELVECFGHRTFCCSCDMEAEPRWHRVVFDLIFHSMKIKAKVPEDPEESILEYCNFIERWDVEDPEEPRDRVIGVTKWRKLDE